jgi:inorganic pyrophosphatase
MSRIADGSIVGAVDDSFWRAVDSLVAGARIVVDRPSGSPHPRDATHIYPLDYGYLDGTTSGDGEGIDVWIGTMADRSVTGVICTVDLHKRDMEIKVLLGCSLADVRQIQAFFSDMSVGHSFVPRPNAEARKRDGT